MEVIRHILAYPSLQYILAYPTVSSADTFPYLQLTAFGNESVITHNIREKCVIELTDQQATQTSQR